jgi:hypothetical protein
MLLRFTDFLQINLILKFIAIAPYIHYLPLGIITCLGPKDLKLIIFRTIILISSVCVNFKKQLYLFRLP